MVLNITSDKRFLQIVDGTQNEIEQLGFSFTKKPENYFILKKKIPHWDSEIKFIDRYQRIPIGLWKEVSNLAAKFHFPLTINGILDIIDNNHDFEAFNIWALEYFDESKITPRDYQLEGANRVLKFKNCTEEISTSGGKTLIAFLIFKYLFDVKGIKKMLYIVPNVNLVTQSEEKFYEYEDGCNKRPNWKSDCAFGGAKKNDGSEVNITFGTYQTLAKKDLEYFSMFDAVCVDEVHHAVSASIKNVLIKCQNAQYKFGLSGTLPAENTVSSFMIQSYLGPKVYTIHSSDLIEAGNATPVNVIGIESDYLENDMKKKLFDLRSVPGEEKDGAKLLNLEKDIARESRKRLNYIVEKVAGTTKNSLVLFSDIKNGYGRKIFNWLKENTTKNVYYIDGGTSNDNRDYYKKQMEENEDTIIIASIGTFSEGIDILNLFNIFVVESYKSMYIVRQVLGRGMRLMQGKEKIIVIDFSDNFQYGSGYQKKNYLMRHADAREQIYADKRFPYKKFKVVLP